MVEARGSSIFINCAGHGSLGYSNGVIIGCCFASTGLVACIKGGHRQVISVDDRSINCLTLGQIGAVKPVEFHCCNFLQFSFGPENRPFFLCVPVHFLSSRKSSMVEPMEGWETILILHIFYQMVCLAIGILPVFPWVGYDHLAGGMVLTHGEECLLTLMAVGEDQGAKGVVFRTGDGSSKRSMWGLLCTHTW